MNIIGIDPGLTGAVAMIDRGGVAYMWDTPTIVVKKGKKTKTEYLPAQMVAILTDAPTGPVHVYIEKVGAMPGQGVTSMFNFGKGFGLWLGILAGLKLPHTLVTPQAWKKELMQGMADKDAARIRAQELFPCCVDQLSRKKDHGRAEALLIAFYGKTYLIGKQK